jgi:hypothetical protein
MFLDCLVWDIPEIKCRYISEVEGIFEYFSRECGHHIGVVHLAIYIDK